MTINKLIVFAIYFIVILFFIRKNHFFGILKDSHLNGKFLALSFFVKALAVPALYLLFLKLYGGIEGFDAGKFYFDSATLNHLAFVDPLEYLKTMLGMQDETEGSHFYKMIIEPTFNWENGAEKDFFYNDNRVVIRIHSLIHFFAFGSYFVHALFSCFFSFIGLQLIYRSFKENFQGREKVFFLILCFFPSLWLYTGGLLKEGWCIFFLGCNLFVLKRSFDEGVTFKRVFLLVILLYVSLLLKPYILLYSFIGFAVYFGIKKIFPSKRKVFLYLGSMLILTVLVNTLVSVLKNKTLYQAALERQIRFADVAEGGIFLTDSIQLIRLKYDWKNVQKDQTKKGYYFIKKDVPYVYWEHQHKLDTLYCKANQNSSTSYSLAYVLPTGGSNLTMKDAGSGLLFLKSFYHTIAFPFFFNAKGPMQLLASLENLVLVLSILLSFYGILFLKQDPYFPTIFLLMGLSLFLLIGFTTPNSGAILRYRAPAAIFILSSAYYYFGFLLKKRNSKS